MRLVEAICGDRPSISKRMTSFALTILRCRSASKFGNDHGVQAIAALSGLAFEAHHRDFLDERRLQVVSFDFFGIDILAVTEDDDFFLAPGEEQMAVRVEIAQIAGEKPSVAQHGGGRIGAVPISLHHDRAAQGDFADRRTRLPAVADRRSCLRRPSWPCRTEPISLSCGELAKTAAVVSVRP